MTRRAREAFVVCLDHERTSKPLFLQLYDTMRRAILDGRIPAGELLPGEQAGRLDSGGRLRRRVPLHWATSRGRPGHRPPPTRDLHRHVYKGAISGPSPGLCSCARRPRDAFVVARGVSDGHPRAPSQIALADFFAEGHFGAHIRRMREVYRERRDALVAATGRHLAGLDLRSTDAGLHAVANLKGRANDRATSGRIARAGVDAQPLSRFHLGPPASPGLFLGYAALSPAEISDAVKNMARAM